MSRNLKETIKEIEKEIDKKLLDRVDIGFFEKGHVYVPDDISLQFFVKSAAYHGYVIGAADAKAGFLVERIVGIAIAAASVFAIFLVKVGVL